ncbi:MAG: outer membrane protein assembly factor BamB [Hydrogenovibrio sp.]
MIGVACALLAGLSACSSPKVVRVAAPLMEMSSPYQAHKDWQLQVDAFNYSDSEGLYFGRDGDAVYFGVPSGTITKALIQPQGSWTDQVVWQKKLSEAVVSGPSFYNNTLIVGTAKGHLMALSQSDGSIVWQTPMSSEVLSRAVIEDGMIFVRTVDGKLYSVNAETGEVNWVVEHPLPNLSLRGIAPVTYDDGTLYVGWESGKVEALDALTGEQRWQVAVVIPRGRTDLERMVDIQAALIMRGGRLFVLGYHGKLVALNPDNGNLYWAKEISGFRDFLIDPQALYVVDDDDIVYAIDYVNGTPLWKQEGFKYRQLADPIFYGEHQLLLADDLGYIHWVDKLDGTAVARVKLGSDYGTSERIVRVDAVGERIFVQDTDGFNTAYTIQPSDWYRFNRPQDPLGIMTQATEPKHTKDTP